MRTGIATLSVRGRLAGQARRRSRPPGSTAIEIFDNDLVACPPPPREVAARCADLGLAIDLFQPVRDAAGVAPGGVRRRAAPGAGQARRAAELGAPTVLACSHVGADSRRRPRPAAEQLHALGDAAAEHGVTVAYEALAWGRHVNRVGQAWEAVRPRRPPRRHPGRRHLPHARARRRRLRARRHPGRPDRLPAGRGRTAARHERARVEPALPLLPRPGHPRRRRASSPPRWTRATAARSRSRCSATWSARPTRRSPPGTPMRSLVFLEDQLAARLVRAGRRLVGRAARRSPPAPTSRSSSSPTPRRLDPMPHAARRARASRSAGRHRTKPVTWWRNGDAARRPQRGAAERCRGTRSAWSARAGRGRRGPRQGAALARGRPHPRGGRGAAPGHHLARRACTSSSAPTPGEPDHWRGDFEP